MTTRWMSLEQWASEMKTDRTEQPSSGDTQIENPVVYKSIQPTLTQLKLHKLASYCGIVLDADKTETNDE